MIRFIRARVEASVVRRAIARAVEDSYRDEGIGHHISLESGRVNHVFIVDLLDPGMAVA